MRNTHNSEARKKASNALKGRAVSEEFRMKMRKVNTRKRPVAMYKDETKVKEFDSLSSASRHLGLCVTSVWDVLVGKNKTAGGYKFKYL